MGRSPLGVYKSVVSLEKQNQLEYIEWLFKKEKKKHPYSDRSKKLKWKTELCSEIFFEGYLAEIVLQVFQFV